MNSQKSSNLTHLIENDHRLLTNEINNWSSKSATSSLYKTVKYYFPSNWHKTRYRNLFSFLLKRFSKKQKIIIAKYWINATVLILLKTIIFWSTLLFRCNVYQEKQIIFVCTFSIKLEMNKFVFAFVNC